MSDEDELIHRHLIESVALPRTGRVVDLGCGSGPTLAAVARRFPIVHLTGVDRSVASVGAARELLAGHMGGSEVLVADLREPVPLADRCADAILSYNLLECLPDAPALLTEIWRLLKPGARAVVAHVDFDSITIAGASRDLDRRICHAFTDSQQPWMDHVDGRIGRKLPGLIRASPLALEKVTTWVTSSTELVGQAARRIENIRQALTGSASREKALVTVKEVEAWHTALQDAAANARFFFAEMAVVVTAKRVA